ncbi:hypothetical protein BU204_08490, partial [Actinophytocola xanthii]
MPVVFDTSGMEQYDERTWFDPRTGDQVSLTYIGLVPDLPAALEDLPRLRQRLAVETAEVGALIEAHVVFVDQVPTLLQLLKVPIPNQETGQAFIAAFTVPKATCSVVLRIQCAEEEAIGVREAAVHAQVGPEGGVRPHPYAPEVVGRLPWHVADDARWDAQFPDHPLSRARAWAQRTMATARIDPGFARLPPFRPEPAPQPEPVGAATQTFPPFRPPHPETPRNGHTLTSERPAVDEEHRPDPSDSGQPEPPVTSSGAFEVVEPPSLVDSSGTFHLPDPDDLEPPAGRSAPEEPGPPRPVEDPLAGRPSGASRLFNEPTGPSRAAEEPRRSPGEHPGPGRPAEQPSGRFRPFGEPAGAGGGAPAPGADQPSGRNRPVAPPPGPNNEPGGRRRAADEPTGRRRAVDLPGPAHPTEDPAGRRGPIDQPTGQNPPVAEPTGRRRAGEPAPEEPTGRRRALEPAPEETTGRRRASGHPSGQRPADEPTGASASAEGPTPAPHPAAEQSPGSWTVPADPLTGRRLRAVRPGEEPAAPPLDEPGSFTDETPSVRRLRAVGPIPPLDVPPRPTPPALLDPADAPPPGPAGRRGGDSSP